MEPLHYLIFHPDYARQKTEVYGQALINTQVTDWKGQVWVDSPGGNEDPFVFSQKWLYSYCHATQLRRKPKNSPYITGGSYLFFCNGDAAAQGVIQLDTVFVIDHTANWPNNQQGLPEEFQQDYNNTKSDLWERHFKYAFLDHHRGTYTYVSRQWCDSRDEYSFLPISQNGERVTFDINVLTPNLKFLVQSRIKGKYPVSLSVEYKVELLEITLSLTNVQVIGNLTRQYEKINSTDSCRRSCKGNSTSIAKGSKQTC
ncbi:MAG: hypothetical protein HWQ38_09030 [Nostoc sp. NMS7]|uniref:hypothetical protein n=1 Tax=Nostoc sp. NMS7 TaxID=2815391 RepID=UPI0025E6AFE7|nr:hypothetical protein [Nostoc sp. NMS7]MBN3946619.1 hypothetical protein [Nostoc sp. NMS7]